MVLGITGVLSLARVADGWNASRVLPDPGQWIWLAQDRQRLTFGFTDSMQATLERYKTSSGLAHRTDPVTFFDHCEVDEGRKP